MSVEIGIEVHLLTGLDDVIAERCEHPYHDKLPQWHEDGDEHYCELPSPCGHGPSGIMVICQRWLESTDEVVCGICGTEFQAHDWIIDHGKVSDFRK